MELHGNPGKMKKRVFPCFHFFFCAILRSFIDNFNFLMFNMLPFKFPMLIICRVPIYNLQKS